MPQPLPYTREFDFTDYAGFNPHKPLPGYHVDAEFDRVMQTITGVLRNLALIQRDDGALMSEIVDIEALSPALRVLIGGDTFKIRDDGFVAAAAYAQGDVFELDGAFYVAVRGFAATTIEDALTLGDVATLYRPADQTSPRSLSYCAPRIPVRTLRQAQALADTIHLRIVGAAAEAGTTGGLGGTSVLVDSASSDPTVPGSWFWALEQAPGQIIFDPRGHFNIPVSSLQRINFDNLTIIAPGRNVTFWTTSLGGGFIYESVNCITAFIEFRTMAGPLSVVEGDGTKNETKLVSVDPSDCDRIAFIGCENRHASDGALDASSSLYGPASTPCRMTIQDGILWDTDQAMLLGANDATCTEDDPVLMSVTLYNMIFAYCGERQPKVLGRTFVDMVNCYTLTLPFQRDNPAPINEFSICYGAAVTLGGRLRARGCLWEAADGVAGYEATHSLLTLGVGGSIVAEDCAGEGFLFSDKDTFRVPVPTYDLPHDPVPAGKGPRDQWVADRWAAAGARVDSAPAGEFVWTDDTTAYPNGETVLVERGRVGRWLRVDAQAEFMTPGSTPGVSATLTMRRGSNYTIAAGVLEIDPDNSYFTIGTEGGAAADDLVTINGGSDGRVIGLRNNSSVNVITLKPGGNIDIAEDIKLDKRGRTIWLIWDTGTARWSIFSVNERISAAAQAALDAKLSVVDWPGSPGYKLTTGLLGIGCWDGAADGAQVWFDVSSVDSGYVAGGSADFARFWSVGTWAPATSRFLFDGSHPYEFVDPPYVGTKKLVTGDSGTYVPAVAGLINVAAVASASGMWSRNGDIVTVSGVVTITPTAAASADTEISIALPVPSNLGVAGDLNGTSNSNNAAVQQPGVVFGGPGTDVALLRFKAATVTAHPHSFMFQYRVI